MRGCSKYILRKEFAFASIYLGITCALLFRSQPDAWEPAAKALGLLNGGISALFFGAGISKVFRASSEGVTVNQRNQKGELKNQVHRPHRKIYKS